MSDTQAISELIGVINDRWVNGRFDELQSCFHDQMVLAMPDSGQRVAGADKIIASYREFGEQADLKRFDAQPPQVDVLGPTAVATTDFVVDYDLDGASYSESGSDLLVLQKFDEGWRVIWRTVILNGSQAGS